MEFVRINFEDGTSLSVMIGKDKFLDLYMDQFPSYISFDGKGYFKINGLVWENDESANT